ENRVHTRQSRIQKEVFQIDRDNDVLPRMHLRSAEAGAGGDKPVRAIVDGDAVEYFMQDTALDRHKPGLGRLDQPWWTTSLWCEGIAIVLQDRNVGVSLLTPRVSKPVQVIDREFEPLGEVTRSREPWHVENGEPFCGGKPCRLEDDVHATQILAGLSELM